MSSRGNRGDNLRWSQRRVGNVVNSGSGGGGAPGTGITNIIDNISEQTFTINLTNGVSQVISKPTTGERGFKGSTGATGPEGPTGPKGDSGSASSMLKLLLENSMNIPEDRYTDIPYSINPPKLQIGSVWDLKSGAHIGVTEPINAFITYGATIYTPTTSTNINSFLKILYKASGKDSFEGVVGTKVAFGSTMATKMSTVNGVGGQPANIKGNAYSAYGSHIMLLNPGDEIKICIHSYSNSISLLGKTGIVPEDGQSGKINYGDTYVQIIDMLGGEKGTTGSQGITGIQGPTGIKGPTGLPGPLQAESSSMLLPQGNNAEQKLNCL